MPFFEDQEGLAEEQGWRIGIIYTEKLRILFRWNMDDDSRNLILQQVSRIVICAAFTWIIPKYEYRDETGGHKWTAVQAA
jgi:hypothetical protein